MTPQDSPEDHGLRPAVEKLLAFAMAYGPSPRRQVELSLADIERLRDALARQMSNATQDESARQDTYLQLLNALGIPQADFETAMTEISADLQAVVERRPELGDMSVSGRSSAIEQHLRSQDWYVDALAEELGLTGDELRRSIKRDPEDDDAGGGGLRDARRAKALCEAACHATYALKLLGIQAGATAHMIGCGILIIPLLVMACAAIAIAEMIIAMMAAQRAYNKCLEAC